MSLLPTRLGSIQEPRVNHTEQSPRRAVHGDMVAAGIHWPVLLCLVLFLDLQPRDKDKHGAVLVGDERG